MSLDRAIPLAKVQIPILAQSIDFLPVVWHFSD